LATVVEHDNSGRIIVRRRTPSAGTDDEKERIEMLAIREGVRLQQSWLAGVECGERCFS
jgi:hypothetical protein